MDKRTFLKAISAITAGPVFSRLTAWEPGENLKNWAGNIEYGTENLFAASSQQQVQDFCSAPH